MWSTGESVTEAVAERDGERAAQLAGFASAPKEVGHQGRPREVMVDTVDTQKSPEDLGILDGFGWFWMVLADHLIFFERKEKVATLIFRGTQRIPYAGIPYFWSYSHGLSRLIRLMLRFDVLEATLRFMGSSCAFTSQTSQ